MRNRNDKPKPIKKHICDKCLKETTEIFKIKFPCKKPFLEFYDRPIGVTIRELCPECARPYLANRKKKEKVTA